MRTSAPSAAAIVGLLFELASAYGCTTHDDSVDFGTGITGIAGMSGESGAETVCTPKLPPVSPSQPDAVPTPGCGLDALQAVGVAVRYTIQTMGTKAPDCADEKCGAWSYEREYFVTLPVGYDSTKAYPLVFQGPGCGGKGIHVYPLKADSTDDCSTSANNSVIRVGLSPPPNEIRHATNPDQGCFDESEGDDSVDFVFYENLYDRLLGQLCFDKSRVFASGSQSGGGRFADELGCKYAGDATRPIRGVLTNNGDWSTDPRSVPTCTTRPMAGMWIHQTEDQTRQFALTKLAIARAMQVNGCTLGTGYDDASFEAFPIVGGAPVELFDPATVCQRIKGCPEATPLVVCALQGWAHSSNDNLANPGFSTFLKLFETSPQP